MEHGTRCVVTYPVRGVRLVCVPSTAVCKTDLASIAVDTMMRRATAQVGVLIARVNDVKLFDTGGGAFGQVRVSIKSWEVRSASECVGVTQSRRRVILGIQTRIPTIKGDTNV